MVHGVSVIENWMVIVQCAHYQALALTPVDSIERVLLSSNPIMRFCKGPLILRHNHIFSVTILIEHETVYRQNQYFGFLEVFFNGSIVEQSRAAFLNRRDQSR